MLVVTSNEMSSIFNGYSIACCMLADEIILCALSVDTIEGSPATTIGSAYAIS